MAAGIERRDFQNRSRLRMRSAAGGRSRSAYGLLQTAAPPRTPIAAAAFCRSPNDAGDPISVLTWRVGAYRTEPILSAGGPNLRSRLGPSPWQVQQRSAS
jgi:hypothetical protein